MEKNILITGGAGYIGSHIMKMLSDNFNGKIVSLDKQITANQKQIKRGIFIKGDIANYSLMEKILKKYRIDIVLHLAGLIQVDESMRKPELYFNNNVNSGLKLLEAMRNCGVQKIIYASSGAVYGAPETKFIKEDYRLRPINVYGLTKVCFENTLNFYHRLFSFNCVIFRFFNVAGADPSGKIVESHKPETHLIPRILISINKNKPVVIFGSDYKTKDGTCIRDYIHVNDISIALTKAIPFVLKQKTFEIFNLASAKGYSVLDVLKTAEKVTGKKTKINWQPNRMGEPTMLVADYRKVKQMLKWTPKYSLEDIIAHTQKSLFSAEITPPLS